MRQEHKAGEKAFVDYAGSTFPIIVNRKTMETREAQLFVGTMGSSSYTYCEVTCTQKLPDWLMSHRRMFEYFGGVPHILVPDNLKSGISKPCRYEATVNRSYEEMSRYYGTCVIPARRQSPKDKGKVEAGVLLTSRWVLAALRNETFYSLEEANEAIQLLLHKINNKPMRQLKKSRRELFETIDKPSLRPLPTTPYVFSEWKQARVNIDYHVAFDGSFYSVPHQLVQKQVEIRATDTVVEVFRLHERIASHRRSYRQGSFTTNFDHRPVSHQEHLKWTPERIVRWAAQKGPDVALFIQSLISSKAHPEQGYRAAVGVIRLADKYGQDRLSKACSKALSVGSPSYHTVKNMLQNKMENVEPLKRSEKTNLTFISNRNVRGPDYYSKPKP